MEGHGRGRESQRTTETRQADDLIGVKSLLLIMARSRSSNPLLSEKRSSFSGHDIQLAAERWPASFYNTKLDQHSAAPLTLPSIHLPTLTLTFVLFTLCSALLSEIADGQP